MQEKGIKSLEDLGREQNLRGGNLKLTLILL
jgi:hypothetical protein